MDVNISLLEELCRRKDARRLSELAGRYCEEALRTSNNVLASELMILKACAMKGLGNRDESLRAVALFRDTMDGLIPEFLYLWGSLISARLMLMSDERHLAETVIEDICFDPLMETDPVLRHDYKLLELEMRFGNPKIGDSQHEAMREALSSYIDDILPLELYLFGKAGLRISVSGEPSPVDRFLRLCCDSGDVTKFLETLEKARISELHELPLWSRLPQRGAGAKTQKAMTGIERRLNAVAFEYRNMIGSIFKYGRYRAENPQLASSQPALNDILDHSLFSQKGKAVTALFGDFQKELQALCLLSPSMNITRAALPLEPSAIQSKLGDGAAALSFHVSLQAIYAGLITKEHVKCAVLDLVPSEAEDRVCRMTRAWSESAVSETDPRRWKTGEAQQLYRELTSPFENELKGISTLFVCPDGALTFFPFHMAESGGRQGSGGAEKAVSLYPSLTALSIYLHGMAGSGQRGERHGGGPSHGKDCLQITDLTALSAPNLLQKSAFSASSVPLSLGDLYSRMEPFRSAEILLDSGQITEPGAHARSMKASLYLLFSLGIDSVSICEGRKEDDGRKTGVSDFLHFGEAGSEGSGRRAGGAVLSGVKGLMTPPVFHRDILYVGGEENRFFALNAVTGELLWYHRTGDWIKEPPAFHDDTLFVGCLDRKVRAMYCLDGDIKWEFSAPGWILGTPQIVGDTIVFASRDNCLFAVDRVLGSAVQSRKVEAKITSPIWSSQAVMILQTADGVIRAFSPQTLDRTWERRICTTSIRAGVIVAQYFVCEDGKGTIMSIRTDTGNVEWQRPIDINVLNIQSLGSNRICLLTGAAEVKCIDLKTGAEIWSFSGVAPSLVSLLVEKDTVLVQRSDNVLVRLSAGTGSPAEVNGEQLKPAKILALYEDLLYLTDAVGSLYRHVIGERKNDEYAGFLYQKKDLGSAEVDSPLWKGSLCFKDGQPRKDEAPKTVGAEIKKDDAAPKEKPEITADAGGDIDRKEAGPETGGSEAPAEEAAATPLPSHSEPARHFDGETALSAQPVLSGRTIVCATDDSRLMGIDAESLQKSWEIPCTYVIEFEPHDCGNTVIAVDEHGVVYVVSSQDGQLLQKFNVCFKFNSPPCIADDRMYIGGDDNVLYCISIPDELMLWNKLLGEAVNVRPLVVERTLIVVTESGRILQFDNETGEQIGEVNALDALRYAMWGEGDNIGAPKGDLFEPQIMGVEIILASTTPYVFSIHQKSQKLMWKHSFGSRHLIGPPVCGESEIYLCSCEGGALSLSTRDQKVRWKTDLRSRITTPPMVHDCLILVGTEDGSLIALEKSSGLVKKVASFKEHMLFRPLNYGDSLIVVEGRNMLHHFTCRTDRCYTARDDRPSDREQQRRHEESPLSRMIKKSLEKREKGSGDDSASDRDLQIGEGGDERLTIKQKPEKKSRGPRTSTGNLFERLLIYGLLFAGIALSVYAHSNQNTDLLVLGVILTIVTLFVVIMNISESPVVKSIIARVSNEGVSALLPIDVINSDGGMTVLFLDHQDYLDFSNAFTLDERNVIERDFESIIREVVSSSGGKLLLSRDIRLDTGRWAVFNQAGSTKNHATRAVECSFEILNRLRRYLEDQKHVKEVRAGAVRMGFGIITDRYPRGADADGGDGRYDSGGEFFRAAVQLQKLTGRTGHQVVAAAPTCNMVNGFISKTFIGSYDIGEELESIDTFALSPAGR
jgi:outer membrane protein assembly factor BamB